MLASNFRPLFSILRDQYPESTVHGEVFIHSEGRLLNASLSSANLDSTFCPRSVLKPWQTRYLLKAIRGTSQDAYSKLISSSYLPIFFASHSGQVVHVEQWKKAASELGVVGADLECPQSFPRDRNIAKEMKDQGRDPATEYHQCSGKHLLFVYACKVLGYDSKGYISMDHPIHQGMHSYMQSLCAADVKILQDGCGLPTYVVSCRKFLEASSMLATNAQSADTAENHLFAAWKQYPRLVGGVRRLDSDITEETDGLFCAKEGADGLLWLQSLSENPVTILIKLGFGYKERYLAYGIFTELLRLKKEGGLTNPDLERLYSYLGFWVQNKLEDHQQLAFAGKL